MDINKDASKIFDLLTRFEEKRKRPDVHLSGLGIPAAHWELLRFDEKISFIKSIVRIWFYSDSKDWKALNIFQRMGLEEDLLKEKLGNLWGITLTKDGWCGKDFRQLRVWATEPYEIDCSHADSMGSRFYLLQLTGDRDDLKIFFDAIVDGVPELAKKYYVKGTLCRVRTE